jgi:hopanoid biosynthesis associated protein HpnK
MPIPDSPLHSLVITGDDFGRTAEVNLAVERYHRAGALHQASLMVTEPYAEDAITVAERNPGLRVGLHLTLCDGFATEVSELTDFNGRLNSSPTAAGCTYAFNWRLRQPLRAEIQRQFDRFSAMGFPPTYWDSHRHLHLHPVVLQLTLPIAREHGFTKMRLLREPGSRTLLHWIFRGLSEAATAALRRFAINYDEQVFGLHRTGRMDLEAFRYALARARHNSTEIYWHPGAEANPPDPDLLAELIATRHSTFFTR